MEKQPSIGRIVHYVSYGTPNGEYKPQCRAAIITEVISEIMVSLCILNPEGLIFKTVKYDETTKAGGTWHWPEQV